MAVGSRGSGRAPLLPIELVPGRLYAIGDVIPLDGRISWVPDSASGYQPINCYLLIEGDRALLVDTGVPIHEDSVVRQLQTVLRANPKLDIYLTRAEMDCVGNLGTISEAFSVGTVYTGGRFNPFDAFDQLGSISDGRPGAESIVRIMPGESIELSPTRRVQVLTPPFKMLASHWAYDVATETLFTSDLFAHHAVTQPTYDPVVSSVTDGTDYESVKAFVESRYWWIHQVASPEPGQKLSAIFHDAERRISRVAPTRGCILEGRAAIDKHVGFLERLIAVGAPPESAGMRLG